MKSIMVVNPRRCERPTIEKDLNKIPLKSHYNVFSYTALKIKRFTKKENDQFMIKKKRNENSSCENTLQLESILYTHRLHENEEEEIRNYNYSKIEQSEKHYTKHVR